MRARTAGTLLQLTKGLPQVSLKTLTLIWWHLANQTCGKLMYECYCSSFLGMTTPRPCIMGYFSNSIGNALQWRCHHVMAILVTVFKIAYAYSLHISIHLSIPFRLLHCRCLL